MTVSIIIPIYNVEPYIADCIRSVMTQDYKGTMECILVDDCGQDKSMEIAEKMVADYNGPIQFRILHHEHNKGLSGARNTGIRAAKGDYVYFLDSDDEITPDCISSLSKPVKLRSYDMVVGDYKVIGSDSEFLRLNMSTGDTFFGNSIPASYISRKWMPTAWNKLYNMEYLRREGLTFKEGLIHEDELWSLEIAATAKSIIGVKKNTYLYKIRENSITTKSEGYERKLVAFKTLHYEFSTFLRERNIMTKKMYFPLYIYAFGITIGIARKIGDETYINTFKTCKEESGLTISKFICINTLDLKRYILYFHVVLPSSIGIHYYDLMHYKLLPFFVSLKNNLTL